MPKVSEVTDDRRLGSEHPLIALVGVGANSWVRWWARLRLPLQCGFGSPLSLRSELGGNGEIVAFVVCRGCGWVERLPPPEVDETAWNPLAVALAEHVRVTGALAQIEKSSVES